MSRPPPGGVRLIARKIHGRLEPEVSPMAAKMFRVLRREAGPM